MTTSSSTNLSALDSLVLTRLLLVGEKGEASSKVKKDLEPLLVHRWGGAELTERVERTLVDLESRNLVAVMAGKTKKTALKFVLTALGRRYGLEFLGVAQLRPKTTWAVLRKTYLPARVVGLPAASDALFKILSSEPTFQAVLLKQQYTLFTAEIPKPDEATDALAWKLIGFESEGRKFNPKNIKAVLFNRALGDGGTADFKKAATRLLAQRLGARRDDPKELRDAVLRNWINREQRAPTLAEPVEQMPHEPPVDTPAPPVLDLPSFAEHVKSVARDCTVGRFGDNKVFIAYIWKALQVDPAIGTMGLAAFKERLAEANNARLLDLSRADLVQAMNTEDVSQSEVRYLNATFHFVRI